MTYKSWVLNDLVAVLKDGMIFYEEALTAVKNKRLRKLFAEMIKIREDAVLELAPFIYAEDDVVRQQGTIVGLAHEGYTKLRAYFGNAETVFVKELLALEVRTFDEVQKSFEALPEDGSELVKKALERSMINFSGAIQNLELAKLEIDDDC